MKRPDPWLRLVAAARRAPADEAPDLPPGFATRVAARGIAGRSEGPDVFGLFARKALGLALAVALTSAAISYPVASHADTSADQDDPVADLVAQL